MGNCFKSQKDSDQAQNRVFNLNQGNQQYGSNKVRSTSSSFLTFIPLNLYHQFSNVANLYFLLICILQSIPQISVTDGKPTTLIPLSFVILTVMVKDAYEQFCRFLKDREENSRQTQILSSRGFSLKQWEDIQVGQCFKVKSDQLIPCDALVLKTSLDENKCFIETKNLDGETNLKVRKAPPSKFKLDNLSNDQLFHKRYQIEVEAPNQFLNSIKGSIQIQRQTIPISIDNVILRGCHLRNCAQAICVAIYLGSDTKVIINSARFNAKKSKMMIQIDKMVLSIFIWQLMISLIVSLFNNLFQSSYKGVMQYIEGSQFWLMAPSWWLMMTYFVPISLIVTMELIKLFQGGMVGRDIKGYSQEYNAYVYMNNTSINQNLGQIKYVFTDKTGTLTKNQMNFKKIIVEGKKYGTRTDISMKQIKKNYPKTKFVTFRDSHFLNNLSDPKIQDALKIIYLCHDIYVDKKSDGKIEYNSSSPDQIALINFAKLCGKQLLGEQNNIIRIYDHHAKTTLKFEKLAFLQFSSDRKKMSVIIKTPANQIVMLTKGADSAVQKILKPGQKDLKQTNKYLQEYSVEGLRTLMLAHKKIPNKQFSDWQKVYKKALVSIDNRQKSLNEAYDMIQTGLELVGGTAVQDKLQDRVEETIVAMKNAGIKFFILTGDKKQTAINIGRSSGLLGPNARIVSYPQEYNEQVKNYKGDKVYLVDASGPVESLPSDVFHHQTICYRCTPIQKANIVTYVKQRTPDLTLAIGDGANDVNMITAADVGVGVKGKQGTQATRIADVSIGEFKFLSLITLYYGRQWYRKNARLACYNFFKNWYHVAAVIAFGSYSYFSAQQIFDIYAYQLFNALFVASPIMIYAIFDQQYNYQQSLKYADIYAPGLLNSQFNQIKYYQSIGRGILYGVVSIIAIFMVLQDDILSEDGRLGYFQQSGAVLLFNIILVANLRIFVMSNGISAGLFVAVTVSIGLYWLVYFAEILFFDIELKSSFYEEWQTGPIIFLHLLLIFAFIGSQLAVNIYHSFRERSKRVMSQRARNFLIQEIFK